MIIDSHAHYNNGAYKKPFRYLTYGEDGYALREGVSFVNDAEGKPVYENTYQYAILKKEWDSNR